MKTRSLTLAIIATVTAFAFLATPAEAGGKKKKKHRDNDCNNSSYYQERGRYQQRNYYQPVQYYRPAYCPPPRAYQRPLFQIGFGFSSNNGNCR